MDANLDINGMCLFNYYIKCYGGFLHKHYVFFQVFNIRVLYIDRSNAFKIGYSVSCYKTCTDPLGCSIVTFYIELA